MSTHSSIAVMQKDGKVKSIYCHFDGYLQGVGAKLLTYYNDEEKANAIVDLGSLSYLDDKLEPTKPGHNFDHPEPDVTVAYHRDRGEDFQQEVYQDLDFYKFDMDMTFSYIFKDGKWFTYTKKCRRFDELTPERVGEIE